MIKTQASLTGCLFSLMIVIGHERSATMDTVKNICIRTGMFFLLVCCIALTIGSAWLYQENNKTQVALKVIQPLALPKTQFLHPTLPASASNNTTHESRYVEYAVDKGDTLSKLHPPGKDTATCRINKERGLIKDCDSLKVGQTILLEKQAYNTLIAKHTARETRLADIAAEEARTLARIEKVGGEVNALHKQVIALDEKMQAAYPEYKAARVTTVATTITHMDDAT